MVTIVTETAFSSMFAVGLAPAALDGSSDRLAGLEPGAVGQITAVILEDELRRWLAATGIGCGDRVTVLRRAPFGGPIHLRTHAGGEFAVDRGLAHSIHVKPVGTEAREGFA